MRKVLVIDDSALVRRIITDILKSDGRFEVEDIARDGKEALALLETKKYDTLILDINMPNMNGLELLEELKKNGSREKVIVASSDTAEGAEVTLKALDLGAFDFIQKPKNILDAKAGEFRNRLIGLLEAATEKPSGVEVRSKFVKPLPGLSRNDAAALAVPGKKTDGKRRIVALASSTGGPNSLQHVIPLLPKDLAAPVLLVQHMPAGFTGSLASRLNILSSLTVSEAQENDIVENGHVYIAKGGMHLKYKQKNKFGHIYYSDEPPREGVKPCANYMYESLEDSDYDEVVCVVLTGMGQDGTKGIEALKSKKNTYVITQNEESCVVYGMPRAVFNKGLSDKVVDLKDVAGEIVSRVGIL